MSTPRFHQPRTSRRPAPWTVQRARTRTAPHDHGLTIRHGASVLDPLDRLRHVSAPTTASPSTTSRDTARAFTGIDLTINDVSANEGNCRHDHLHLHGQPLGARRRRRRDVRHRDRGRHGAPAADNDYVAQVADRPDDPRGQLELQFNVTVNGDTGTSRTRRSSSTSRTSPARPSRTARAGHDRQRRRRLHVPFTPIYQIQGSGLAAAITGNVTTQGVVVGDFEGDRRQLGLLPPGRRPATATPPPPTASSSSRAARTP